MFPNRYNEIYRSCAFHIDGNVIVFDCFLPENSFRWGYWSRFFKVSESDIIESEDTTLEERIKYVRLAIDRAWEDNPCYIGDIKLRSRIYE